MPTETLVKSLEALVREKQELDAKERALLGTLSRVLSSIGYRLVPDRKALARAAARSTNHAEPASPERSASPARSLTCAECGRRFARPVHLGRHMSAAHGRRRGTRGRRRAA
jgi:hypothetical protein